MLRSAGFSLRNALGIHAIQFPTKGIVLNVFIQPIIILLIANNMVMETSLPYLATDTACMTFDGHRSLHGSNNLAERQVLVAAHVDEQMDVVRHDDEMIYGIACLCANDAIADDPCFREDQPS